jgi:hypothetical protein
MAVPSSPEIVTGRVAAVNPKGVKLEGQNGWLNFSKCARDIVPPMRGQLVTLTPDRQGYVRAVQASDGSEVIAAGRQAPGAARDATITRLAVLKAAAEFAAARPPAQERRRPDDRRLVGAVDQSHRGVGRTRGRLLTRRPRALYGPVGQPAGPSLRPRRPSPFAS